MRFHPYVADTNGSRSWIMITQLGLTSAQDGGDIATNTTSATNSTRSSNDTQRVSPIELQITLVVGLFLVLLFLIYVATFYIRRQRTMPVVAPTTPDLHVTRPRARGVEQSVIDAFPVIGYAAVKIVRTSKSPLECAICLSEFVDDDVLRLLPGCRHVFHTNCISTWLENHVTCPVCRSNLSDPNVLAGKRLLSMNSEFSDFEFSPQMSEHELKSTDNNGPKPMVKEIRRAQSITEGWERFTLTLPDQVLKDIEAAGKHRRSTSVQDYTFQGKASWRDRKFRALFKSFSRDGQNREGDDINMSTVIEGAEASVSTATSSRHLNVTSVHGEKYEHELAFVEVDLTDQPIHERVRAYDV